MNIRSFASLRRVAFATTAALSIFLFGASRLQAQATQLIYPTVLTSNHVNGYGMPNVVVNVANAAGATQTGSSASITASLTGPGGFSDVITHNASSGTWTFGFSGTSLTSPGLYTLTATSSGLSSATMVFGITVPMVSPQGKILAGAFPNDSEGGLSATTMDNFETYASGRTMAIDMHYFAFTDTNLSTNALFETAIGDDTAMGRIPLVSWHCPAGGSNHTVYTIYAHDQDATIEAAATSIAAHNGPVIVRWFWEVNLVTSGSEGWQCLGYPSTGNPSETTIAAAQLEYQKAWGHIQSIFAEEGAYNVIWDWNPGASNDTDPNGDQVGTYTDAYFPAVASGVDGWLPVDWVGIDAYNRKNDEFQQTFWNTTDNSTGDAKYGYGEMAAHGLPILVGENGALYDDASHQVSYFNQGVSALQQYFPDFLGYVYFASDPGTYDWDLSNGGSPDGVSQYAAMVQNNYLNAPLPASGLSYSTYGNFNAHVYAAIQGTSWTHGTNVTVNAQIGATTLTTAPTGTVKFYAGGMPMSSTAVTLSCSSGAYCKATATVQFPSAGTNVPLVAVFTSGDTNYPSGQSWPVFLTVN